MIENNSHGATVTNEIPKGVAKGTRKVHMLDPQKADGKVKELFQSIKVRHGHPLVSSYYRALGNWPDFLETVWEVISPHIGSAAYETQKQKIIDQAHNKIKDLPIDGFSRSPLIEEHQTQIKSILAAFRLKFIPEMLMDVSYIKVLLDGKASALSSRFSVA